MLALILLFCCFSLSGGTRASLYVGALFESSNHWYAPYSHAFRELIELAFEEIGNRTDVLGNYDLKLIVKDTEGIPGLAAKRMFELISEPPTKIAVLGPLFSDELTLVGEITPFYNLLQLSFVAGTSTIKDRAIYSSLYSVGYIQDDLNPLRIAVMKYFGWTKVATFLYDDDFFTSQIEEFHTLLQNENFTLVTSSIVIDADRVREQLKRLRQYDARIIFGAFRSSQAPEIFCEAYRQGIYGKKYVWILPGGSMYTSWTGSSLDNTDVGCTKSQILKAAEGYITLDHKNIIDDGHKTINGKTSLEYDQYIRGYLDQFPNYKISRKYPFGYDAVWALALCLNASMTSLNGEDLLDFNYSNTEMYNVFKDSMDRVSFNGVSGPVSFKNGRRIGFSYIQSNADFVRKEVAEFDPKTGTISWIENPESLFEEGKIPKDQFTYITEYFKVPLGAIVPTMIFDCIGAIVAVGFLTFNIMFRNNKIIKMSSPRINNLIVVGAMVMYLSVCVSTYSAYTTSDIHQSYCMINTWVYSLGFTTVFGALFSKTWRVHVLLQQRTLQKKTIKDTQLFGMVGVLLSIDVILLTAWTAIHPLSIEQVKKVREASDDDVVLTQVFLQCNHTYFVYWALAIYIYKGILLVFGTFLAWETRKINIAILNDSKLIGFCVYNIVVVCVIGVPTHHVLEVEQTFLKYLLSNGLTIFCTTMLLCILFVPKISLRNQTEDIKFVTSLRKQPPETTSTNKAVLTKTTNISLNPSQEVERSSSGFPKMNNVMNITKDKTAANEKALVELSVNDLSSTMNSTTRLKIRKSHDTLSDSI